MKDKTKPWIELASKDLIAAETLKNDESLNNLVLFHCQQSIEKSFKALFEENDLRIPRIHSTLKLYTDIMAAGLNINLLVKNEDLVFIDDVYLDTRYPGGTGLLPSGFPTNKEKSRGLEITRKILGDVKKILLLD